ncbi:MAG: hypothetical protein JXB29_12745 [Sedimentisphaerales bacterium]|nr:hypothetical protein [Sedimentisphaerales bacterium]
MVAEGGKINQKLVWPEVRCEALDTVDGIRFQAAFRPIGQVDSGIDPRTSK